MPTPLRSPTRSRPLFGSAIAAALVLATIAASAPARLQDPKPQEQGEADTPLLSAMESMQSSLRTLRKQVDKPEESANALITLRAMQTYMTTAYGLNPPPPECRDRARFHRPNISSASHRACPDLWDPWGLHSCCSLAL